MATSYGAKGQAGRRRAPRHGGRGGECLSHPSPTPRRVLARPLPPCARASLEAGTAAASAQTRRAVHVAKCPPGVRKSASTDARPHNENYPVLGFGTRHLAEHRRRARCGRRRRNRARVRATVTAMHRCPRCGKKGGRHAKGCHARRESRGNEQLRAKIDPTGRLARWMVLR